MTRTIIPFHEAAKAIRLAQAEAVKPDRSRHSACPMQTGLALLMMPTLVGGLFLMAALGEGTRDDR